MLHMATDPSSPSLLWPQIITALASVFTALAILVTAIGGIVKIRQVDSKLGAVHTIVNQQHTDLQRYQVALTDALTNAGVAIPPDQSLNVTPTPPVMP